MIFETFSALVFVDETLLERSDAVVEGYMGTDGHVFFLFQNSLKIVYLSDIFLY